MFYFIKTPGWLKKIYASCIWQVQTSEKDIYLSFDDGPHPIATPFVLDLLKRYQAKATFFCIGKNVALYPALYNRIIKEGHAVGNHSFDHLNGWKTTPAVYIDNIEQAQQLINSNLYRPPYGKITFKQIQLLTKRAKAFKVIMWSVLSADFDTTVSNNKCLQNVLKNTGKGSIIVFHDSEKALEKLQFALPEVMAYFATKKFEFKKIEG